MPIGNDARRADAGYDYQDLDARSIREPHGATPLNSVLAARLFRRPIIVFGGSVATIRHRGGPRLRLEIAAMRVIRIQRSRKRGTPRLQRRQGSRADDERGAPCAAENAQ